MLYNEAFLSMDNLIKYLDTYPLDHICAESTLYLGENDLIEILNRPIANHYTSKGEQALFKNVAADIKKHYKEYFSLYKQFSDPDSQNTLFGLMKFRLAPISAFLSDIYSFKMAYLDNTILHFKEGGTIVDYGDHAEVYINYLQSQFPYHELIIYSRDKKTFDNYNNLFKETANLKIVLAALGSKTLHLKLPNPINPKQTDDFISEALDDTIKNPLSFLRINANGQEADVLLGAKQHIKNDTPAIAICVGNKVSDLWTIPKLIKDIYPNYHFYLRHYSTTSICDTILYAIPEIE